MKKIIVWYNPNKEVYYYRVVKCNYVEYTVGFKNSYNHEIVLVIDDFFVQHNHYSLKKRLIKKIIRFLDKKI